MSVINHSEAGSLPIGVFDSGIGGLTVIKEIMSQLPNERIIYFGDTARLPYGSKSRETVTAYSRQITRFLLGGENATGELSQIEKPRVKAIVIACNTASAIALEQISSETPVPMLGVVYPGTRAAMKATRNGSIGVIATEATIQSGIYREIICGQNPELRVYGKACPLFVPLVEEGWLTGAVTEEIVRFYLNDLMKMQIDSLVLGCTHYPLIREVIRSVVGDDVVLVNPAFETAKSLQECLKERGLLNPAEHICTQEHAFYVSDGAEKFRSFANSILPDVALEKKDINLVEIGPGGANRLTK